LLIAFPNADDPPSGNHESLESKIPKRKKARPNTRLSCKIEYFIETTSAYLSGRSAFFTDDCPGFQDRKSMGSIAPNDNMRASSIRPMAENSRIFELKVWLPPW
jgi:hypothetical protein